MVRGSLMWLVVGLATPAIAQSSDNPPASGPMMVRDFMDAIPRLDEVPYEVHRWYTGTSQPLHREQIAYHNMNPTLSRTASSGIERRERPGERN